MAQGHTVKLMPAQYVKPYVKGNKHDANDAAGICEAVSRPSMRFTSIQHLGATGFADGASDPEPSGGRADSAGQPDSRIAGRIWRGVHARARRGLQDVLEDAENGLSGLAREMIADVQAQLTALDQRIDAYDTRIDRACAERATCQRLLTIPGIGPKTATALVAAVNDAKEYPNGRALAASLGLTPREHSTGGKHQLLGITKRGNVYLHTLMIHGARTVLRHAPKRRDQGRADAVTNWALNVSDRRHLNVAAVALANKNARIAWALLTRQQTYRSEPMAA
jgi:transposase